MGDLFGGPFFVPASLDCGGTMGGVMTVLMIPVAPPLWQLALPPFPAVRWGGKRKAPLNFSFPLEGKCHVVAKGCTRVNIPMKLTIVLLGLTSPHLEVLCRTSTGDYGERVMTAFDSGGSF